MQLFPTNNPLGMPVNNRAVRHTRNNEISSARLNEMFLNIQLFLALHYRSSHASDMKLYDTMLTRWRHLTYIYRVTTKVCLIVICEKILRTQWICLATIDLSLCEGQVAPSHMR